MSNMLPSLSRTNKVNQVVRNFVLLGEGTTRFSVQSLFSNLKNLFFGEFGGGESASFWSVLTKVAVQAKTYSMTLVLGRGNPFKVLRSVVSPISVLVIYLGKLLGIGDERLCYESMNKMFTRLLVMIKHNHLVPIANEPRFKIPTVTKLITRLGKNVSRLTGTVPSVVSFNRFHGYIVPRLYLYAQQ